MRLEQDPRYRQQIRRQSVSVTQAERAEALVPELQRHTHGASNNAGLWSEDLGTGATMGALNYPAKFSLTTTTASCNSDFVVYPTGLAGSTTQASIVAYSNLYSGCGGTVPSVYWAYYIGDGNTIQSSPVFSLDGTQIAFMQETTGSAALVLLKWVASTTETVAHPDSVGLHGSYTSCHPPCMDELNLNDAGVFPNDTNSSIFVDYPSDTAFVGDDSGYLHKFNPVFNGAPAEVGGVWPVLLNPSTPSALTSPVYDSVTGNVFVTDKGGFLYRVNSSTAAVTASGQLDFSSEFDGGPGMVEGPILDYTAGVLYAFATSDGSGSCPILAPDGSDCSAVDQLPRSFLAGDAGSEAVVGSSTIETAAPSPMYIGAFDTAYKNSADATGNLYVCGNTGGAPTLFQVPIVAGAVSGEGTALTALSTTATPCSPVTHVMNANIPVVSFSGGPTEWVFASADNGRGLLGMRLRRMHLEFQGDALATQHRLRGGPGGSRQPSSDSGRENGRHLSCHSPRLERNRRGHYSRWHSAIGWIKGCRHSTQLRGTGYLIPVIRQRSARYLDPTTNRTGIRPGSGKSGAERFRRLIMMLGTLRLPRHRDVVWTNLGCNGVAAYPQLAARAESSSTTRWPRERRRELRRSTSPS